MKNALKANPLGVRQEYEKQLREQQEAVPRRSVNYEPVTSPPKIDPAFEAPSKEMIEENPSFGYRTVACLLGFN